MKTALIRSLLPFMAALSLAFSAKCKGQLPKKFDYTSQHTGTKYHFSWNANRNRYSWNDARKYCRSLCMDMVSFEDGPTWFQAAQWFQGERAPEFFWTSGRKCNFKGCDAARYQPVDVNGWIWALSHSKREKIIVEKAKKPSWSGWSHRSVSRGVWQPDNRELREKGNDEACLAVLNNLYRDGLKWHDIACHHRKPVVCQRKTPLAG